MKKLLLPLAAAALLCASCNGIDNSGKNNPYKVLELSTKGAGFVEQGNVFAFQFIDKINEEESGDYIISPLSMQFLLGMILNGAQGATAEEICSVLGYGAGETAEVNDFCRSLLTQLPAMDKQTKLTIANAIFVDDGWPLKKEYVSTVGKAYDAEVTNLDFSDGAGSLREINGWCNRQTNGMIPKVLDEVSPEMLAYLMNAMYFKGQWKEKFQKGSTADETFTDASGKELTVKMMKQEKEFGYTENDIFQAVRLPYGNGVYAMTVLLPKDGYGIADIIGSLQEKSWRDFSWEMSSCTVNLWLPRFETKYKKKLNDILSEMGMPTSFDESLADFKAMSDFAGYLSYVQQDAIIKVDEEGTEAAVVSHAGMVKDTAMPSQYAVFHADHPFLYLITENSSSAILFAGKYSGK